MKLYSKFRKIKSFKDGYEVNELLRTEHFCKDFVIIEYVFVFPLAKRKTYREPFTSWLVSLFFF